MKNRFLNRLTAALLLGALLWVCSVPAAALELERTELTLCQGQQYPLHPQGNWTYTVNNQVVTVSAQGVITAQRAGQAVVTVRDEAGDRKECRVTVLTGTGPGFFND